MTSTASLEDARAALRQHFGYTDFRPGQSQAVESVLQGHDTLVVLPTGGGKSICYQVPAMMLPHLTVVISPLISLMKDQVDALTRRGLPATFVNSSLTASQVADRLARAQRGEFKLLYVAPERFDVGSTAERLKGTGVSLLAVDEAHCISEWGHDFRPSYLRIARVRERLGWPPVVALTATATPHVRTDIVRQLKLESAKTVITGFDRRNLRYHVVSTRTEQDKDEALVGILRQTPGLAVVYASTRRTVERITSSLNDARVTAVAYHAGLDDAHRRDVQDAFMKERVRVIVATNAFGMGIDKPNVRLVMHYAMPGTLEAYYQEAGRAGRDGEHANCFLLHSFQDRFTHEFFIKGSYPERTLIEDVYRVLRRSASSDSGDLAAEDIASSVRGKVNVREVEGALRILASAGAYRRQPETGTRAHVRLLATPQRIKRELGGAPDSMELGLLRSMWRVAGSALEQGASIDLDGLPPGFGGTAGVMPLLDALQDRQFLEWKRAGGGNKVEHPQRELASFDIDWDTLDRRRRAELAKLDAMQQYAYLKSCRRGFVLRYFGDPAARPKCGDCDNCLGTHVDTSTLRRPSRERSRGRRTLERERTKTVASDEVVVDDADGVLLERLRALRRAIAKEQQVPAYVVFPDRTLAEMAVRRPRTVTALAGIRGVGPTKLERYGERFLNLLRSVDGTEAA
ncbi:MAG TPA: ATP-dependent DNA helicase RecQ [Gemmatimonadaceae bacterium]|nr:ATP-dependent DNA helicase RecQ [Gemmatimonadaceae bacterium]